MGSYEDRTKVLKITFFFKPSAPLPSNYAVPTVITVTICFILHLSTEFRTFFSKNQILECSTGKKILKRPVLKACFIKGNFTAQRMNKQKINTIHQTVTYYCNQSYPLNKHSKQLHSNKTCIRNQGDIYLNMKRKHSFTLVYLINITGDTENIFFFKKQNTGYYLLDFFPRQKYLLKE